MSLISLSQRYIALAIGNTLNVFCRNTAKLLFKYECDGKDIVKFEETQPSKAKKNKNKNKNKKKNDNEQKESHEQQECKESKEFKELKDSTDTIAKTPQKKDNKQNSKNVAKCILISHIVYSSKHDCFIIVSDDKYIRILMHSNNNVDDDNDNDNDQQLYQLQLHRIKKVEKKISSICLNPLSDRKEDEEYLLSADKFGVICLHYLPSLKIKYDGTGHLTIITHIAFDSCGKYLMSADKDFKIRISRFPQLYIIDAFCYGHTQAVTKFVVIDHDDKAIKACIKYILSGSVDGTLRFWSIPSGKQLNVIKFKGNENENENDNEENKSEDNDGNYKVFDIDCNECNEYNNMIKDQPLIITDIKYFPKTSVVAISFNKSCKVYLFGLDLENELKPSLILLNSFDLLTDCNIFNGLYDMIFDDNGNLMTLCCCKEKDNNNNKNVYLVMDVFTLSKTDNKLCVQSARNNIIIEMIQKQTKEISNKMENCEIVPLFMGLVRDWEIGDQIQKNHNIKDESDNKIIEPPAKKQKLDTDS